MNFRKWVIVLFALTLFAGLASAQLTCQTNQGTVTPVIRAEGYTELVGDIVLACTGGVPSAVGTPVPQVNFSVALNSPITSRLLPGSTSPAVGALSEALLMIDEPGSGLPSATAQSLCGTPLTGCAAFAGAPVAGGTASTYATATTTAAGGTAAPTVFQGVVSGNSVTFFGVPVLAPGTTSTTFQRTFRITNIRTSGAFFGPPPSNSVIPVNSFISTSQPNLVAIGNPTPVVGFVSKGLVTSFTGTGSSGALTSFLQCTSQGLNSDNNATSSNFAGTVTFTENFGTAFKTRVDAVQAGATAPFSAQGVGPTQNVPGKLYNSESGFIYSGVTGTNSATAGLADFGTRLKAVFLNIPSGISHIYVSVNNVSGFSSGTTVAQMYPVPTATEGTNTTTSIAQLVTSETVADTSSGFSGAFPGVSPTLNATNGSATASSNVPLAEVPISGGSAEAVWEVMNTNPNTLESMQFAVYVTYTSNGTVTPAVPFGTGQVMLSYAPSPTPLFLSSTGTLPTSWGAASSSLPIPRFVDGTASNFITFSQCQTVLLWPYVTTLTGFNTGFAISNTTVDPGKSVITKASSGAQSGTCALYLYGTPEVSTMTLPSAITVPLPSESIKTIAGGTTYANDLASVFADKSVNTAGGTPFSLAKGYMFGVCNFQYAHGYAAISDSKAANWVTSYLALVVDQGNTIVRGTVAGEGYIH